jgi:glycosyltransferase involved in cell wall biosynthesis
MRILHLIDSGGMYGAEGVLLTLMEGQRALGMATVLGSMGLIEDGQKPIEAEARRMSLDVEPLRTKRTATLSASVRLAACVKQGRFDVVHTHGYKPNILLALLPRSFRGAPVITTLHGWCAPPGWSRLAAYESLERRLLRRLDACVFVARSMLDDPRVRARAIGRVAVIPNGLAWRTPEPPSSDDRIAKFCSETPVIGSFGRLSEEKGYAELIEAVGRVRDRGRPVRLVILGEGPERRALEVQSSRLDLGDRVLMPGYVAHAGRYLPLLTAYVLASHQEGMPMTILEAMFAGTPIVATRVGAVPEMLGGGDGGALVDRSDPEALAHAIEGLLDAPEAAAAKAAAAQRRANADFSAAAMTRRYADVYDAVVRGGNGSVERSA